MKYNMQVLFFLLFLISNTYSQGTYSLKIVRSNTHSFVHNTAKKDTIQGTVQIPKKNSLEDIALVTNKGVFKISNSIWKGESISEKRIRANSNFKLDNQLQVLTTMLFTENLFYGDRINLDSTKFKNIVAINTTRKIVIFGIEERKGLDYSCYSIEIKKSGNQITKMFIDYNRVENTSAYERNISEYWELTKEEKDDNNR